MSGTWQALDFVGKSFNNILFLGVAQEETDRRMYEDKMVESLAMVGASVKALVTKNHHDGVLVTRLSGLDLAMLVSPVLAWWKLQASFAQANAA